MPVPTEVEIRAFALDVTARWNAHDREGYLRAWRERAPGGVTLEDPVGSPLKQGWEQFDEMFDRFNASTVEQRLERLFVRGNELALVYHHTMDNDGEIVEIDDIETWLFGEDGTILVRAWWDMPDGSAHAESLAAYEGDA